MAEASTEYPASLSIDYPERNLNRRTTFFRIFIVIPILIILGLIGGSSFQWDAAQGWRNQYAFGGVVSIPTLLMLLFRQKYPKWWFDWNLAITKFIARVFAYIALLRDEFPSTDEDQAVHIAIPYPDARKDLKRGLPLVKWLLAVPHYIVLAFLIIGVVICAVIAWFAILFTGRYPASLFNFVVGVFRWLLRVGAYAFLLTTDRYPPFRLGE